MLTKSEVFHVKQFLYSPSRKIAILILAFSLVSSAAESENLPAIPGWGGGKCEILIFSDYFCLPCQRLEKDLEPLLFKLVSGDRVKLFFVDLPLYPLTSLYSGYFLRAVQHRTHFDHALAVRKLLFELAFRLGALQEEHLEREFKSRRIPLSSLDPQETKKEMSLLVKRYAINSVPACVVNCPGEAPHVFRGTEEILEALRNLCD